MALNSTIMEKNEMIQIKAGINKLRVVVSALAVHWPSKVLIVIDILLQNISHDGSSCSNYSYDDNVKEMFTAKDAIAALSNYHTEHPTISFIREEVDDIFSAAYFISNYTEDEREERDINSWMISNETTFN